MSDDPSKKGPRDRKKINPNQDYELRYWSKALGVTREKLKELVKRFGNSAQKVRLHLSKS